MKITKGEVTFSNKEKPLALSIPQVLLGKKYDSYFCGIYFPCKVLCKVAPKYSSYLQSTPLNFGYMQLIPNYQITLIPHKSNTLFQLTTTTLSQGKIGFKSESFLRVILSTIG